MYFVFVKVIKRNKINGKELLVLLTETKIAGVECVQMKNLHLIVYLIALVVKVARVTFTSILASVTIGFGFWMKTKVDTHGYGLVSNKDNEPSNENQVKSVGWRLRVQRSMLNIVRNLQLKCVRNFTICSYVSM